MTMTSKHTVEYRLSGLRFQIALTFNEDALIEAGFPTKPNKEIDLQYLADVFQCNATRITLDIETINRTGDQTND